MSELNLIPFELKAKRKKVKDIRNYVSFAVIILCVFIAIILAPKFYLNKLANDEQAISEKITNNSQVIVENKNILAEINSYKVYYEKVDSLINQKTFITEKIKNIEKYIPKDVILINITLVKGSVNLSGVTTNYTSIGSFTANLQLSKEYKLSKITSVKASTKVGSYEFLIIIKL